MTKEKKKLEKPVLKKEDLIKEIPEKSDKEKKLKEVQSLDTPKYNCIGEMLYYD